MKIYLSKLKRETSSFWYVVDIVMIFLIILNLLWMGFDMAFTTKFFRAVVFEISPTFHTFYYDVVHPDFLFYDLFFVAIFLSEFMLRWGYSVYHKKFDKWYIFPFYYWYELIGCLPLQAFRFLRLIRIVSLIIRLQKKGVIDVKETWWYKIAMKYYYIFVEEVSDRVTVNVISGAQDEIKAGNPIVEQIIRDVIMPKKDIIAHWASERVKYASAKVYVDKRDDIRAYVALAVKEAVSNNKEIADLEKIPVLGRQIAKTLESSIGDITSNVIEKTMIDLAREDSSELISEVIEVSLKTILHPSEESKFEEAVTEMTVESLELVKEQVKIKRWKTQD